jgi:hypothetical protein
MTVRVQSTSNRELREVQLALKRIELEQKQGKLVFRSAVVAQMLANAAEIHAVFVGLPSRIRQALQLTLDEQSAIERVIDEVMADFQEGPDTQDAAPAEKLQKVRRKTASPGLHESA